MSSQASTPARSSRLAQRSQSRILSTNSTSSTFTTRKRDAQARNKDSYSSDSSDSAYEGTQGKSYDAYGNDSYEMMQQRRQAAIVLDSPELLMMHAQARNDSIPGTRYYFTKMLCGYLSEKDTYLDETYKHAPDLSAQREPEKEGKTPKSKQQKGKGKDRDGGAS